MLNSEHHTFAAESSAIIPHLVPRWMKPAAAAFYSGLGRSLIYQFMGAGKIKSHRVRGVRLIDRESLDTFIASQPAVPKSKKPVLDEAIA